MVYSTYKRQRILSHYFNGHKAPTIAKCLQEEGLKASRVRIAKFLTKFQETGSIGRRLGSSRPSKITAEIKRIVEEQMHLDDETTAHQLHKLLKSKGYSIFLRTILRCRTLLGWTFRGSSYCQLISHPNKLKHFEWAKTIPTATKPSRTSYSRMSVHYSWRATKDFVTANRKNRQIQSQGTCMHL